MRHLQTAVALRPTMPIFCATRLAPTEFLAKNRPRGRLSKKPLRPATRTRTGQPRIPIWTFFTTTRNSGNLWGSNTALLLKILPVSLIRLANSAPPKNNFFSRFMIPRSFQQYNHVQSCLLLPEQDSGPMRFYRLWERAVWARCTAHGIRDWSALLRSRFCLRSFLLI
jgi:hypothetical protein